MPLLGLALNVSWQIVYALYVCEAPLETAGFTIWLLLDIGPVYMTIDIRTIQVGSHKPLGWMASCRHIGCDDGCGLCGTFCVRLVVAERPGDRPW